MDGYTWADDSTWTMPAISDERLSALIARMHPIYVEEDGQHHYMKIPHLRKIAYMWDPESTGFAPLMRVLGQVQMVIKCGYHGFFKPSIAEVLAALPPEFEADCIAFTTPLNQVIEIGQSGEYQRCVSRFYAMM